MAAPSFVRQFFCLLDTLSQYTFLNPINHYGMTKSSSRFSPTHRTAGVGGLRRVRNAIGVARAVFDYTEHSLIVGDMGKQLSIYIIDISYNE